MPEEFTLADLLAEVSVIDLAMAFVALLILVVGLFSLIVSLWLAIKYRKFNRRENSAGLTGEQVARKILDDHGLTHIKVKTTGSLIFGNSYSHILKKVRLRRFTRRETSLTALGMGAQKAALAVLAKEKDPDMKKRIWMAPMISFGPFAFVPMLVVGVLLDMFVFTENGFCTITLGCVGLLFYVFAIVLTVLTLKTEKKAQQRAYEILQKSRLINEEELECLQSLFRLYNIQYINDIILAVLELIYTVLQILGHVQGSGSSD